MPEKYEDEWSWQDNFKAMEQSWMVLKDQYSEIARALGFEGDAFFGDPLASHSEIVWKAKFFYEYHRNHTT